MTSKIQKNLTKWLRSGTVLVAAFAVGLGGTGTVLASDNNLDYSVGGSKGFCIPFSAPVALGDGLPRDQKISGTYCQPYIWGHGSHQIDVLTSGAGYTSAYWNWPVDPGTYSYVRKTLGQGRATLSYDRVGSGKSSHPLSTSITLNSDAYVLHSIIKVLRFGGYGYKQVNSIGHSYGTGVVLQEAGVYKDVSRVIATGYLHNPRDPAVGTRNYPANQDPMFAGFGFDDGYLTSRPGTRGLSFYNTAYADPDVIAYDEAHKDVVSRTAFLGYAAQQGTPAASNISNTITVPVMAIVGQQDAIFCVTPATLDCSDMAAVQAYETPFYSQSSSFNAYSVANTGHDIALHPSALSSFNTINHWIKTN